MAWMETHYYSYTLRSNIVLNVLVPTPGSKAELADPKFDYEKGLPVVYLLHGAFGDAFSWLRFSNIDRYAQDKGVVVVMASAENSFYQDMRCGKLYKTFFTEELPTFVQRMFPVSKRREDTYIAGFSMGGYGAWYLGLTRPDLYAKAASMSGAVDIAGVFSVPMPPEETVYLTDALGDFSKLAGSQADLLTLCGKCLEAGCIPKLYQTVGISDYLYRGNLRIRDELQKRNVDLTYVEAPGAHDWDFWEGHIQEVLNWLLEKN